MKRFVGALLVALAFAAPVMAQDEPQPGEGDRPRRGDRGPGGRGGFGLPMDQLKERLGLNDEQMKKLEGINTEMMDEFRKVREDMQKGGDFDWNKMREKMKEGQDKIRGKIREILNDDQKGKFDAFVKEEDERRDRFMRGGQGGRGDRGPGGPGGPDPERMKKRLYDQAERELTLSAEEKAAVMPLVQKVLDARADARTNGDKRKEEFTAFVRKTTGTTDQEKSELTAKLAEFRKAREADNAKVKDAQQALRDVLTIENEAKLVAIGVLD